MKKVEHPSDEIISGNGDGYLPSYDVSPEEFRYACEEAGWAKAVIDTLLRKPRLSSRIKVGWRGLKIVDDEAIVPVRSGAGEERGG